MEPWGKNLNEEKCRELDKSDESLSQSLWVTQKILGGGFGQQRDIQLIGSFGNVHHGAILKQDINVIAAQVVHVVGGAVGKHKIIGFFVSKSPFFHDPAVFFKDELLIKRFTLHLNFKQSPVDHTLAQQAQYLVGMGGPNLHGSKNIKIIQQGKHGERMFVL